MKHCTKRNVPKVPKKFLGRSAGAERHKSPKLAPATLTSYRNNARIHIKPYVGEIPLRELSTYHIQRMLDGIGGSLSTFIKNYNIIHGALEKAVELGMIPRNPCKGVAFPKDDKRKMRVLTKHSCNL